MSSDAFLEANGLRIQTVTTSTDIATYYLQRFTSHAGGTPGFVNAGFRVDLTTGADVTNDEWAHLAILYNYANAGENVAGYRQGNRYSTGATWGGVDEVYDWSGGDPTTGAVALEVDVNGNGTDVHNNRQGIAIVVRRPQSAPGASMECGVGIDFQNSGDALTLLKTGIRFKVGLHVGLGIDFSEATYDGGVFKMASGQVMLLDALPSPNKLGSQGLGVDHFVGGALANRLLATGGLQVGANQVVGSRQSVTGSRATDAWRVSLMAALATHGLITDATTA